LFPPYKIEMRLTTKNILPILIILITFVSANQWNKVPLGNTYIVWAINFLTIGVIFWYKRLYFHPSNKKDYFIVALFLVWMLTGVIRGIFVAENYWEWKQFISGTLTLSLPLFVYVFSVPQILQITLKTWIKYALPAFFLFFIWTISPGATQYYLGPVFMLSCFFPLLKRRFQLILLFLLSFMLFSDFGARSQMIKAASAVLVGLAYLMHNYFSDKVLKIAHWLFYLSPVILLFLGISGKFNILQEMTSNQGKYVKQKVVNGEVVKNDLLSDSRTSLYEEIVLSAVNNHYVLWGRTPARGNDSMLFGSYLAIDLKTNKYERHCNEFCFPNIFTWLGFIGMGLYCLIYLKSSYLAVYKSNNIFMKLIGVFIAFRFLYGWLEDFNRFDIMNISLWMIIAMGFSQQLRTMNNLEFKYWFRSIF
jgi:hypothetical protein